MTNKKIVNILMISGLILTVIIFLFKPDCFLKKIFTVPCPICGMTRAFKFILKRELISALKMNLLSIPLFISIIIFYITYFISIFFKKDYIYKMYSLIIKYYKVIILILLINWIINIVKFLYY